MLNSIPETGETTEMVWASGTTSDEAMTEWHPLYGCNNQKIARYLPVTQYSSMVCPTTWLELTKASTETHCHEMLLGMYRTYSPDRPLSSLDATPWERGYEATRPTAFTVMQCRAPTATSSSIRRWTSNSTLFSEIGSEICVQLKEKPEDAIYQTRPAERPYKGEYREVFGDAVLECNGFRCV